MDTHDKEKGNGNIQGWRLVEAGFLLSMEMQKYEEKYWEIKENITSKTTKITSKKKNILFIKKWGGD